MTVVAGIALAAAGVVLEAVLFRTVFDRVASASLDAGPVVALLAVAVVLFVLAVPVAAAMFGLGRLLDRRLRQGFAAKLPRLPDDYLRSRAPSDVAERSHSLHRLRLLPEIGAQGGRAVAELAFTVAALIWLDPASAVPALLAAAAAVAVPLAFQPTLAERDLRLRTHQTALGQLALDALLGLVPLRAHRAGPAVLRAHDELAVEWRRTGLAFQRTAVAADGVQALVVRGVRRLAAVRVRGQRRSGGRRVCCSSTGPWPSRSSATTSLWRRAAGPRCGRWSCGCWSHWRHARRSRRLRMDLLMVVRPRAAGVKVDFDGVRVVAAGHEILHGVDLHVRAGEHLALIGLSGAGKSTLIGMLLGWHRPSVGEVRVDDEPLTGERLRRLRDETAWVDPAVQLWNRSLAANLLYGAAAGETSLTRVVDTTGLGPLVAGLANGLDTPLGEGGGLVSGGEGQRVRLGRALCRPRVRLVLLDEPFRGLDRPTRAALLAEVRSRWKEATVLCATHDVGETAGFDRVVVLEGGSVVEYGSPRDLAADPDSRYRSLLDAEQAARRLLFAADGWRHWHLEAGQVSEVTPR